MWWVALASAAASWYQQKRAQDKMEKNPPPSDAGYEWQQKYGPETWNKLYSYGSDLLENPYGIPEEQKSGMRSTARDVFSSGLSSANRGIDQAAALSGRSAVGGDATRQRYYAGEMAANNLGRAYRDIDMADFQAREEQKNRGANLLMALTNRSPVYAQIASQNYWNTINASMENSRFYGNMIGSSMGNAMEYYQNQKYMDQMEAWMAQQGGGSGGGGAYSPVVDPYTGQSANSLDYQDQTW